LISINNNVILRHLKIEVFMKKETDFFKKGKDFLEKGLYKEALINFLNALKDHSDWPDLHNYLGLTYNLLGDLEEAVKQFKTAIKMNKEYIEAHLNLALTYNDLGMLEESAKEFDIAAKMEKKKGKSGYGIKDKLIETNLQLGDLYFEIGQFDDAIESYKKADKIAQVDYPDIKVKLAKAYMQKGKYSIAVINLKKALLVNKNLEEAMFLIGLSFFKSGRQKDAKKVWEDLLKHNPSNDKVKAYLHLIKE